MIKPMSFGPTFGYTHVNPTNRGMAVETVNVSNKLMNHLYDTRALGDELKEAINNGDTFVRHFKYEGNQYFTKFSDGSYIFHDSSKIPVMSGYVGGVNRTPSGNIVMSRYNGVNLVNGEKYECVQGVVRPYREGEPVALIGSNGRIRIYKRAEKLYPPEEDYVGQSSGFHIPVADELDAASNNNGELDNDDSDIGVNTPVSDASDTNDTDDVHYFD